MVGMMLAMTTLGAAGCLADPIPDRPYPVSVTIAPPQVGVPLVYSPGERAPGVDEATPLWASVPVRIQIPAIGVDSELMALGLESNGEMTVPPSGFPAGWYTGAPTPGEMGPAIIVGHVDWDGPGVFYNLHKLKADDEITVAREDGSAAIFRVTDVQQYPKDEFPTALVYGGIEFAGLRLITCGGVFSQNTGHYEDNLVVYAQLVRSVMPPRAHVDVPAPITGPRGLAGDVPPGGLVWLTYSEDPSVALNAG
jgi:sortase (surface protein transpeptidase)